MFFSAFGKRIISLVASGAAGNTTEIVRFGGQYEDADVESLRLRCRHMFEEGGTVEVIMQLYQVDIQLIPATISITAADMDSLLLVEAFSEGRRIFSVHQK